MAKVKHNRQQVELELLKIVYRDDFIVAIDKPPGLLVHRSRIDTRATEFALQRLRDQIGQEVFLTHRLDRPTSGVLLFALNSDCARRLSFQFENGTVKKNYLAIVRGHTSAQGRCSEALQEKLDPISDNQAQTDKPAQQALTLFKTLRQWEVPFSAGKYPNSRYSEVNIEPKTGRKHQIRRHFNRMAHPIVGDSSHGDLRHNRLFEKHFAVSRLLLVAHRLQILHPITNKTIVVVAAPDREYEIAVKALNQYNLMTD